MDASESCKKDASVDLRNKQLISTALFEALVRAHTTKQMKIQVSASNGEIFIPYTEFTHCYAYVHIIHPT